MAAMDLKQADTTQPLDNSSTVFITSLITPELVAHQMQSPAWKDLNTRFIAVGLDSFNGRLIRSAAAFDEYRTATPYLKRVQSLNIKSFGTLADRMVETVNEVLELGLKKEYDNWAFSKIGTRSQPGQVLKAVHDGLAILGDALDSSDADLGFDDTDVCAFDHALDSWVAMFEDVARLARAGRMVDAGAVMQAWYDLFEIKTDEDLDISGTCPKFLLKLCRNQSDSTVALLEYMHRHHVFGGPLDEPPFHILRAFTKNPLAFPGSSLDLLAFFWLLDHPTQGGLSEASNYLAITEESLSELKSDGLFLWSRHRLHRVPQMLVHDAEVDDFLVAALMEKISEAHALHPSYLAVLHPELQAFTQRANVGILRSPAVSLANQNLALPLFQAFCQ
jgi:hypothetical protein